MNRIKQLRNEKKINQDALARLLGLEVAAISKLETGRVPLKDDYIIKLSNYFEVSTDYLLGKTDNRNSTPLTEEEMGFVSQVKELEPAQKDFLKSVMKTLKEQKNKDK